MLNFSSFNDTLALGLDPNTPLLRLWWVLLRQDFSTSGLEISHVLQNRPDNDYKQCVQRGGAGGERELTSAGIPLDGWC